jgi:hypothetical protein
MSACFDSSIRLSDGPTRGIRSHFSTERSRLTTLLLAGKKTVPLPQIPGVDEAITSAKPIQPAGEAKHSNKT